MKTDLGIEAGKLMPATRAGDASLRVFSVADAREIARSLVHGEAGAQCHWSASALDTVATIILWEAVKGGAS